jgi:adenylosuccinate synthase
MIAYMIIGGQWGSEGKGLFAGYMAIERKPDAVVCQFGPNAGHTWIEGDRPIVFKSLPVASIAKSVTKIFLGPGSVIDPEILAKELTDLAPLMHGKQVFVHEGAAILIPGDAQQERGAEGVSHIASTRQGTSVAMIRKIQRRQPRFPAMEALKHLQVEIIPHDFYRDLLWQQSDIVQIEGSQGMDLSINSGMEYPYTTSRDCTPAQVLADCGIHPDQLGSIYSCIRTFPIRVGNIVSEATGELIGSSGPCYGDQAELTWYKVGQPEELTTVTKRVRRVFSFSGLQTKKMLDELKPTGVFLNFANYLPPTQVHTLVDDINRWAEKKIVRWVGYGPKHTDIIHLHQERPKPIDYQE